MCSETSGDIPGALDCAQPAEHNNRDTIASRFKNKVTNRLSSGSLIPDYLMESGIDHEGWRRAVLTARQNIQRAGTEAFQVEGDVTEAERLEDASELRGHLGSERPGQLSGGNFDANDVT